MAGAGCADPAGRPASWSYVHAAVVAPSCATASCHGALTRTAGLRLDDSDLAHEVLIGRQYVIPGDPDSPLLYLLEGEERDRMPPDAPLPQADIELIRRWIAEGAQP